ncbi:ShlB/FhaC/HecB family hemolysin secretion/activation protein [Thiorhodovibrio winogradskyi]|nr:ShlB/FhaC/HecB family hemolysin secretion/activation protein [Thiorhodovibrio winogradskyi]
MVAQAHLSPRRGKISTIYPLLGCLVLASSIVLANPTPESGTDHPPASASEPGFVLRSVHFDGGNQLPNHGLDAIIEPFLNQWTTLAEVEELRYRLTKHHVDQGYTNSGVVLVPNQIITDGVLQFRVIAGRLQEVRVSGQGRLHPDYVRRRIHREPDAVFNRFELQERFQLLLQDKLIDQIHGTLQPGDGPGTAILDLAVTPARTWEVYLRTDNARPPSTGAERGYIGGTLRNLTRWGDELDLYIGLGYEGQGKEGGIDWSIPLNARGTRFSIGYERSDAALIEELLRELDINSETQRAEVALAHPLWHNLRSSLELGLMLSWAENTTTLLGEPFSFSLGAVSGESRVAATRLFVNYAWGSDRQAFALYSQFSLGIDALDATIHSNGWPDSDFFSWLGQVQYVRNLTDKGTQLILRGAAQFSNDTLLPLERFAVGGLYTVRGYRENTLVGDQGYAATLELRYPLWQGQGFAQTDQSLQLAVFTDVGSVWDHARYRERQTLASVGFGLLWTMAERLRAEFYYGHALEKIDEASEDDLQDRGFHFLVQVDF